MPNRFVVLASSLSLIAAACGGTPDPSNPASCAGAPAGPSGGAAEGMVTICAIDEAGTAIQGATVNVSGMEAGVTDANGQLDVTVDAGSAIEVRAAGLVPHTVLGVASRRFGVVLPGATHGTRTVTGTLSGINELRLPPDGYRRVIEIRAGTVTTPIEVARELAVGAPADCTIAGDECTFSIEVDERVSRLNATVIDTTSAFADRLVAAFAVSDPIGDGPVDFVVPQSTGTATVMVDAPTSALVAVAGARYDGELTLFGSGTATDMVAVPGAPIEGTPILALLYQSLGDELISGVLTRPAASTVAPPEPGVTVSGETLSFPSARTATISLAEAGTEVWRATLADGRTTVQLPSLDSDNVAVLVHGTTSNNTEEGDFDRIEGVVRLPVVR